MFARFHLLLLNKSFRAWTASSRLFYALARDNALPFKSKFMSLSRGQAPWLGVWISVLVGSIICCAYIGSPVACMFFPALLFDSLGNLTVMALASQCYSFEYVIHCGFEEFSWITIP
jgi:amino acid transporter